MQKLKIERKTEWYKSPLTFLGIVSVAIVLLMAAVTLVRAAEPSYSLWEETAVPEVLNDQDLGSVELGVRFHASENGTVTGVKFYKGPKNSGTHTGSLWNDAGERLASVTFENESALGWQRAYFAEPVAIEANRTYTVSYHAPNGQYAATENYFSGKSREHGPLRAPETTDQAGNGVYAYGNESLFPTSTYHGVNYWVDVIFKADAPAARPGMPSNLHVYSERESLSLTWQASTSDNASIAAYRIYRNGSQVGEVSGDTLKFHDSQQLDNGAEYTYQVRAVDSNNKESYLSQGVKTTFAAPIVIWPEETTDGIVSHEDANSVELGVKFRAASSGKVMGVKFYKGEKNTGTHTGTLWDSTGTKLATVTFENESASGWQRAYFAEPVAIEANKTYVVSYYAPEGNYAAASGYFHDKNATNGPLTALQNHADGVNGVFRYGSSGFPDGSYNAGNYWVDVIFTPSVESLLPTTPQNAKVRQNLTEVTLTWDASRATANPITAYDIYRNGTKIAQVAWPETKYIETQPLEDRKVYNYQVRAVDIRGEASAYSGAASLTYLTPGQVRDVASIGRVAWEGGPAFYDRFPQAKAMGWTNDTFFPIGLWGTTVENERDVATDKEVGINTYLEIYKDGARPDVYPNFPAIKDAGMSAIHHHSDAPNTGNETVGWFLSDEPEQYGQAGVLQLLKDRNAVLPQDGRFRFTNFTANMMLPNFTPGDAMSAQWLDESDINSLDVYWYTRDLVCSGSIGGEVWKDGSGAPQSHGSGYNNLSNDECHRASNYGYQIDAQRRLSALSGKQEPVWTFVETGHPFTGNENRGIKPRELAGAVWNSLIHEARGINYFNHSFSGSCESSNVLRDPLYVGRDCYVPIREKVKQVNAQVRHLAPVLNTQSLDYKFNPKLDTMFKEKDGAYYIFAMPSGIKGGSALGDMTLQLPSGINAEAAEVLFEDRQVRITDGKITDNFIADYEYHIYKIIPRS